MKIELTSGAQVGQTPIRRLSKFHKNLFVKLEYHNLSGSIKDRAANYIIQQGVSSGQINTDTTIVESSSGNFAIALASICIEKQLKFIPVIDPNIIPGYEQILKLLAPNVIKVCDRDSTGGFLLTRIKVVQELCVKNENFFWTNQYENPDNYKGYFSMAREICEQLDDLDFIFIGVSSGGTITGLSIELKRHFPKLKVVAVDVEGSMIFSNRPKKRNISGIGSSKRPTIIELAQIDEIVIVSEHEIFTSCNELLVKYNLFGGASTGASFAAIKKYFGDELLSQKFKILMLCPDRGSSYIDTIYNKKWCENL